MMMTEESQLFYLNRHTEEIQLYLHNIAARLRDEQAELEMRMLNDIVDLKLDIRNLHMKMQEPKVSSRWEGMLRMSSTKSKDLSIDTKSTEDDSDNEDLSERSDSPLEDHPIVENMTFVTVH
jgi:hypothetical protein